MNVINGAVHYLPDCGVNWSVSVCCGVGALSCGRCVFKKGLIKKLNILIAQCEIVFQKFFLFFFIDSHFKKKNIDVRSCVCYLQQVSSR